MSEVCQASLVSRLRGFGEMIRESEGIAGFHLNGDVEPWDDLEAAPDEAADRIAALESDNTRLRDILNGLCKTLIRNGNFDDGCFYYNGVTASELESSMKAAWEVLSENPHE